MFSGNGGIDDGHYISRVPADRGFPLGQWNGLVFRGSRCHH